jgi:formylglycine-generating enzyme required for sulfatase activity
LPENLSLKETLSALRRGHGARAGKKVLIVLDQFEQWLHAKREEQHTELVQALRQCDGGRVQCLVLVRDDFWLAATRFLSELEINLVQGQNTALADLFDLDHAKKVLAGFGRAFGKLPENSAATSKEHKEFLNQAVSGLAQENRIICVRLALFAEMLKGRPWTPATLKAVGGTEGVGVTFLEETFSSPTANPRHRLHQKAARAVLRALLPESGTDIKGHMRSYAELLEASGYAGHPKDFEDLLRILDSEIRLITPTDPEGNQGAEDIRSQVHPGQKYYQLTHDYLVPSLRDWLTRKQKETRRGRAELRLAERAASWNAKPENRHLPAWWEWANIHLFTRRREWTPPQRKMMRQAGRYHGWHGLALALLLTVATVVGLDIQRRVVADRNQHVATGLVARLCDAEVSQVPAIISELGPYRTWADPQLIARLEDAQCSPKKRLHLQLALLPVDAEQAQPLQEALLRSGTPPAEVLVLREALRPHQEQLVRSLWERLEDGRENPERRFRAGCALALYDPESPRWHGAAPVVVNQLVAQNPFFLGGWSEALRPVRRQLLEPLSRVFRDQAKPTERSVATNLLADYAADHPPTLAELIKDADPKQYALLWPRLEKHRERAIDLMKQELTKTAAMEASEEAKDSLAKRQAQAAVVLLQLGQEDSVWPLLQHSPDPRRRTYLIHSLSPLGTDAMLLVKRLEAEADVSSRRALIRSLGEFSAAQLPEEVREPLVERLVRWYRDDPDPGIHGAIDWLLRHGKEGDTARALDWGQAEALRRIDQERTGRPPEGRRWSLNTQGQTFALFPGPVEFLMGSPESEPSRWDNETLHCRRIDRSFSVASKPVTIRQFQLFLKAHPEVRHNYAKQYSPDPDEPIVGVTWYEAAQYCRWLSEQEGIPEEQMCYPAVAVIEKSKDGQTPLKLPTDYLSRIGYRLPSEAEWECACRAGAQTSRYYGAADELLGAYAWYLGNAKDRAWPVGQKRPNDFGLFDMHGNVWQWCHESAWLGQSSPSDQPIKDTEDIRYIDDKLRLPLRGGAFLIHSSNVRSAYRRNYRPTDRNSNVGLRPARTYR